MTEPAPPASSESLAALPRELARGLGSSDRSIHRRACEELVRKLAEDASLYPPLVERLRKGSPLERFGAAWVLFRARRPSLSLLPALLESLALEDGDRRWEAAHMLATLGRIEPQVCPVVQLEARKAAAPTRRRMSLFVLRELAPEQDETRSVFIGAVDQDDDPGVRRAALSCFPKLAPTSDAVIDRTLSILAEDRDPRMQFLASAVSVELAAQRPQRASEVRTALERASQRDARLAQACRVALSRLDATRAAAPNEAH